MPGACGSAGATDQQPAGTIGGVGVLPDQAAGAPATTIAAEATTSPEVTTTVDPGAPSLPPEATAPGSSAPVPIADQVTGNRLLMVGDSIFAATAPCYGDNACATLGALEPEVDVEAESGRAIDFGERVVRQMMPKGWNAVVFFLDATTAATRSDTASTWSSRSTRSAPTYRRPPDYYRVRPEAGGGEHDHPRGGRPAPERDRARLGLDVGRARDVVRRRNHPSDAGAR